MNPDWTKDAQIDLNSLSTDKKRIKVKLGWKMESMRGKKSILLLLVYACMIGSVMALGRVAVADSTTRVYIHPETTYAKEGDSVTLDINVADVEDLHTWQVMISFDPEVLQFVNVTEGDFLQDQPEGTWTTPPKVNSTVGTAMFAWYTQGDYAGVGGDGWLATVEFLVLTRGESILNITNSRTYLVEMVPIGGGKVPQKIPCTLENGFLTSLVSLPVAEFTSSLERPRKNELVIFNASASDDEDGYIVSYGWDFGDNTTAIFVDANLTDMANHTYTTSGQKTITLNVTDDMGLSSVRSRTVWVKFPHDVAVANIQVSSTEVVVGEAVTISVMVTNLGEESESFDVIAYYGGTALDAEPVTNLAPDAEATVTFNWDTTEDAPDDYTISAKADLEGDGYAEDNVSAVGTVTVNPVGEEFPWTLVVAAVVIVAVIAVGAFLLMRRGT